MTAPHGHVVALGGGHGLARTLGALRDVAGQVTAVVTVADDGGSSGRLRRDLGVLPPGDLRMAMLALCADPGARALLSYRFRAGDLEGHSLGNLLLVAMADLERGLVAGLDRLGATIGASGRVLPSTTTDVTLHGTAPDGSNVHGQVEVAACPGVDELRLDPPAPEATPDAVDAIVHADLLVLGPGSVCTSVLPNLLVPGVGDAVRGAQVPVVLVANLDQQTGEGEGRNLSDHLDLLRRHADVVPDVVLVHEGPAPVDGRPPLVVDVPSGGRPTLVARDLASPVGGHDEGALAKALSDLLADR